MKARTFGSALLSILSVPAIITTIVPAFAGPFDPSADVARQNHISGTINIEAKKLGIVQLIDGEVTIDGKNEQGEALWYRLKGGAAYGSSSGRVLKVDGTKYRSCPTTLEPRSELSGTATVSVQSLPNHISIVTLVTKNGQKLFSIARDSDVSMLPIEGTANNIFFDIDGRFYDQTPRELYGTRNTAKIAVEEIIPNCN
jgi:hypothetical protein